MCQLTVAPIVTNEYVPKQQMFLKWKPYKIKGVID
jgi:hypothetical protein